MLIIFNIQSLDKVRSITGVSVRSITGVSTGEARCGPAPGPDLIKLGPCALIYLKYCHIYFYHDRYY